MAYYEVDFIVANNADWFESFEMATDDQVLNLENVDMQMDVRSRDGKSVVFSLLIGDGITIDDPAKGRFSINVPRDAVAQKTPGNYIHDLLLIRSGRVERLWSGGLKIVKGVTV